MTMIIVACPHCKELVIIEKRNCGIFRHGVFKKSGKQINSHLDQASCESLIRKKQIYGCGKPFRILENETIICDYI